ncbi:MAG: SseB family protein [Pseudomonadota bacterium]
MDPNAFIPHNDLEKLLTEVTLGTVAAEDFVARLMAGDQVFMPVKDEKHAIAGFQTSTRAQPLVIEDDDGTGILALFTSPERAKPFAEMFPDFKGGLLTEFTWVLRHIGGGFPISINPGWDVGMDFDADTVAQLIAALPEESKS